MKGLLELYKNDPVSFVYVDKKKEQGLWEQFGSNNLVAYKPKRNRYAAFRSGDLSQASIKSFVDDILGGGGSFTVLKESELAFNTAKSDL